MAKKKPAKKKTAKKKAAKKKTTKKRKSSAKKKTTDSKSASPGRRPKSVESSLASVARVVNTRSRKDYGYVAAGENYSDIRDWISTGCTPFDVQLWGGWPRGRVINIEGDPSQGKSTLMEAAMAQNHRVGGANVLLMSESCIDSQRMQREGVDMSTLLPLEIDTFEQGVFYIYDVLTERRKLDPAWCEKHPLLLAWDTPSNAQEQHIFDNPEAAFDKGMASKARNVRSALRTIVPLAGRLNVTIMLLLQQHQKIGPYGGKEVDCGGGPKFNASLRVHARQVDKIYAPGMNDREIGIVSLFDIRKSKAGCPPFRNVEAVIRSWDGIDNDASMFRFLLDSWAVDPCPVCGGKKPTVKNGQRVWESQAWKTCEQCNGTGSVYHLIDGETKTVCVEGKTSLGNNTQWRYIFGWPEEEKITTTDSNLRQTLNERPGLRTWMAEQCWLRCTRGEPAVFHPVE